MKSTIEAPGEAGMTITRDEIIVALKAAEPQLRSQGVAHAALFGSVARGEQRPDSDIDIMIELEPNVKMGVYEYVGIMNLIEDLFPTKVDIANRNALKDYVRPSAERDAVYAF